MRLSMRHHKTLPHPEALACPLRLSATDFPCKPVSFAEIHTRPRPLHLPVLPPARMVHAKRPAPTRQAQGLVVYGVRGAVEFAVLAILASGGGGLCCQWATSVRWWAHLSDPHEFRGRRRQLPPYWSPDVKCPLVAVHVFRFSRVILDTHVLGVPKQRLDVAHLFP